MRKIRIEMLVPDELDSSQVLQQMQAQAVKWLEQDVEDDDLPQGVIKIIEDQVSVQEIEAHHETCGAPLAFRNPEKTVAWCAHCECTTERIAWS